MIKKLPVEVFPGQFFFRYARPFVFDRWQKLTGLAYLSKKVWHTFDYLKQNTIALVTRLFFFFVVLWSLVVPASAQSVAKYPQNYFRWPLNLKPEIVANLGELRPNHWHMGLDMRTNQKVNQLVYAAAGGYISRIRIERSGFGRCIWINHPNGLTTLYAHLNDFFPALEEYVTAQQYKQETWAIELEFTKDQFPVSKGQFISYSGTTGGSQGPHVHFEIRATETDECLNPSLFGFPLADKVPPVITKLALYDRRHSIYDQPGKIFPVKYTKEGFIIPKTPLIKTGSDRISFGIQAIDRLSGSRNEDGIYSATLFFDEEPVVGFVIDSISYAETGYMNAHIDYKYRYNGGPYFQNLFRLPGDHGGVYHSFSGDGAIVLPDTAVHAIRIEVWDAYRNRSELSFSVQYDESLDKPVSIPTQGQPFAPNYVNILEKDNFEIYIPETCLFDTVRSFYYTNNSFPESAVSAMHQVNDASIPVQGDFRVRIKPARAIGADVRDKVVIQRSYRNSSDVRKATWEGEWMSARFSDFGNFQAFIDDVPPNINSIGSGDTVNLSPSSQIVFTPTDNFGVRSLRVELDGKWLRFTNDKGRNWIYKFDERCPYGIHELKVTATDIAGNITEKTWWFKRYPYTPPKKKAVKKKTTKKATTKKKPTTKKR